MERGEEARAEIGRVRHQRDALRLRERRHLAELGDAADLGDAGLRIGHGAGREHLLELVDGAGVLPRRDGNAGLRAQRRQGAEILRREDRLLEPVEIVGLEAERVLPRLRRCPGTVGVHHDRDAGARGLASGLHLGLPGLVQLDVAVAFRQRLPRLQGDDFGIVQPEEAGIGIDLRARRTAQQLHQRLSRALARQIPERDVEARQRKDGDAVTPEEMQRLLHPVQEPGNVPGIATDRERRHHVVDGSAYRTLAIVAEGVAPADEAVLGLDAHQQRLEPAPVPPAPALGLGRALEGDLERNRLDAHDLHGGVPSQYLPAR